MYLLRIYICLAVIFTAIPAAKASEVLPEDRLSAVVLSYHRIGEETYPDTNITQEQFDEHVRELQSGQYHIMPLPVILDHIKTETPLPTHALAITFEGAYRSSYENGMKKLLEAEIPFTVFFSSDLADNDVSQFIGWGELESLHKNDLVELGILPSIHERLTGKSEQATLSSINRAKQRYRDTLGTEPHIFSYPFGEYTKAQRDLIASQGFTAAFGLQSGVLYSGIDMFALPRFTMTESHGDLDRFTLVANALPLPATNIEPEAPSLGGVQPLIGFTPSHYLVKNLSEISCFISGQGKVPLEIIGDDRVEIRPAAPLDEERTRVNCTMPGPSAGNQEPRWRWLGMLVVDAGPEDEPPAEGDTEETGEEISIPPPDELP